jgi:hypothetical protein
LRASWCCCSSIQRGRSGECCFMVQVNSFGICCCCRWWRCATGRAGGRWRHFLSVRWVVKREHRYIRASNPLFVVGLHTRGLFVWERSDAYLAMCAMEPILNSALTAFLPKEKPLERWEPMEGSLEKKKHSGNTWKHWAQSTTDAFSLARVVTKSSYIMVKTKGRRLWQQWITTYHNQWQVLLAINGANPKFFFLTNPHFHNPQNLWICEKLTLQNR